MGDVAVSLCMIVKNEEHRLQRCLESVAGIAPEIVIVDTGSTDATCDVAAQYGAKVTTHDLRKWISQPRATGRSRTRKAVGF